MQQRPYSGLEMFMCGCFVLFIYISYYPLACLPASACLSVPHSQLLEVSIRASSVFAHTHRPEIALPFQIGDTHVRTLKFSAWRCTLFHSRYSFTHPGCIFCIRTACPCVLEAHRSSFSQYKRINPLWVHPLADRLWSRSLLLSSWSARSTGCKVAYTSLCTPQSAQNLFLFKEMFVWDGETGKFDHVHLSFGFVRSWLLAYHHHRDADFTMFLIVCDRNGSACQEDRVVDTLFFNGKCVCVDPAWTESIGM